ncbi:MAG: alpha,alpha-phosphotrehalase [Mycoplasmataceae bacterium]|nr:alpha,alpha-phosphotrehalase [Mycoplasmataceae bacterium]
MKEKTNKYNNKVVYEIYVKAFNDSNNDGIGDIKGVTEKLEYLSNLGIDYIWLTPIFKTDNYDNGYDIVDYYSINPEFGTMDDVIELIETAKKYNIKIMLDMILNHSSINAKYFQDLINNKEDNSEMFHLVESKNEPTNWKSKFGGSAWKYVENLDKWYLHLFAEQQIDMNWTSEKWRNEAKNIINFWLDKGIGGLRFDVVNLYAKPENFIDDNKGDGRRFYTDNEKFVDIFTDLANKTFKKKKDIFTVGELSSTTYKNIAKYTNEKSKMLDSAFSFMHLKTDYVNNNKWNNKVTDIKDFLKSIKSMQREVQKGNGTNAVFLNNHDQPRANSRFLPKVDNYLRSTLLANFYINLSGVPFIYQGEEFGMTNPNFESLDQFIDIETKNKINELRSEGFDDKEILQKVKHKSRDNGRSTMWWSSNKNAGFSNQKLEQHLSDRYKEFNYEKDINSNDSVFKDYQRIIELRKNSSSLINGDIKFKHIDKRICVYTRDKGKIVVISNFSDTTLDASMYIDFSKYRLLYSNREYKQFSVKPYQTITLDRK